MTATFGGIARKHGTAQRYGGSVRMDLSSECISVPLSIHRDWEASLAPATADVGVCSQLAETLADRTRAQGDRCPVARVMRAPAGGDDDWCRCGQRRRRWEKPWIMSTVRDSPAANPPFRHCGMSRVKEA